MVSVFSKRLICLLIYPAKDGRVDIWEDGVSKRRENILSWGASNPVWHQPESVVLIRLRILHHKRPTGVSSARISRSSISAYKNNQHMLSKLAVHLKL